MNHVFIPFEYHGFIVTKRGRQIFQEDNNGNILPFYVDFTPSSYISNLDEEDREELFYRMLDSLKTDATFKFRLFANEGFRITAVSIDPEVKYSDDEIRIGALVYPVYEDAMRKLLKFSYSYRQGVSRKDLVFAVYEPGDPNEKKKCSICPIDALSKVLETFGTSIDANDGRLDVYTLEYTYEIYQANCSYKEDDTNYGNITKISCKCYNYFISTEWHRPDADEDAYESFMQCRASNILHVLMANFFGIDYDSRMIMGQDLLSDSEGLVVLANRSWFTDTVRYNSVTDEIFSTDGSTVDSYYISKMNNLVDNQFKISNLILENNYYEKVFKQDEID